MQLAGVNLTGARLEGAVFDEAHMEGKEMEGVALERVRQWDPNFPASLPPTNLPATFLDANTSLKAAVLGDETRGGVSLVDAHLDGVNLAAASMEHLKTLGEETEALRGTGTDGKAKDDSTRLTEYQTAVRANRQFAVALRNQGLSELADHFTYRAKLLQRQVLRQQRAVGPWLFSLFLAALSGYGYRLGRILFAYGLALVVFAAGYFAVGQWFGDTHLAWYESFLVSLTAIHGRVFFEQFGLDNLQSWIAAVESVVGIVIEGVFVAMLTQRFFAR